MYYEIREADAWKCADGSWEIGNGQHIRYYKTNAKNKNRAFCYALRMDGICFERGATVVVDDTDACGFLVLKERKTGKPLYISWLLTENDLKEIYDIESASKPGAIY